MFSIPFPYSIYEYILLNKVKLTCTINEYIMEKLKTINLLYLAFIIFVKIVRVFTVGISHRV